MGSGSVGTGSPPGDKSTTSPEAEGWTTVDHYHGGEVFVGALIARRRRELGRSQLWLADRLCAVSGRATVTRTEVSRYERGARIPGAWTLRSLALALNLPLGTLERAAVAARCARHGLSATLAERRHVDNGFGFCRTCRQFSPCDAEQPGEGGLLIWLVSMRRGRVSTNKGPLWQRS